ncbi:hypothetical protein PPL_01359 [Heterostelium album PN500]|uniref:Uncharacterized protein n=1 Tax=Heterostelium pallidum (strain ATCC 26659 / Pp 5 / PN500) TaxID=670386 RepID=D3AZ19_HETP5|nr:hypothetical protein PPL_01359 [Heterostelium album PN500]EFA85576.1 hypothetical protein PPL_01359 [Heterostelium album PN500]|eukprot:XP_020437683.1 hypothetical protein PPL_01359 [Heterostelium album PN500]
MKYSDFIGLTQEQQRVETDNLFGRFPIASRNNDINRLITTLNTTEAMINNTNHIIHMLKKYFDTTIKLHTDIYNQFCRIESFITGMHFNLQDYISLTNKLVTAHREMVSRPSVVSSERIKLIKTLTKELSEKGIIRPTPLLMKIICFRTGNNKTNLKREYLQTTVRSMRSHPNYINNDFVRDNSETILTMDDMDTILDTYLRDLKTKVRNGFTSNTNTYIRRENYFVDNGGQLFIVVNGNHIAAVNLTTAHIANEIKKFFCIVKEPNAFQIIEDENLRTEYMEIFANVAEFILYLMNGTAEQGQQAATPAQQPATPAQQPATPVQQLVRQTARRQARPAREQPPRPARQLPPTTEQLLQTQLQSHPPQSPLHTPIQSPNYFIYSPSYQQSPSQVRSPNNYSQSLFYQPQTTQPQANQQLPPTTDLQSQRPIQIQSPNSYSHSPFYQPQTTTPALQQSLQLSHQHQHQSGEQNNNNLIPPHNIFGSNTNINTPTFNDISIVRDLDIGIRMNLDEAPNSSQRTQSPPVSPVIPVPFETPMLPTGSSLFRNHQSQTISPTPYSPYAPRYSNQFNNSYSYYNQ